MASQLEIDALDLARINAAEKFVISLYMGFTRGWIKTEAPTLAAAEADANRMNDELSRAAFGRRAMIFGVEKCGRETFVPKHLYPSKQETTP